MVYAKNYKTRKEAISIGKIALKYRNFVYGTRGGKIKSSQARVSAIKTMNGFVPIAKRK